jgi:Spy/CpxP family protein refolding chaperone
VIRIHFSLAVLSAALIAATSFAAPVPKADPDADKLLARVRVENLGGLLAQPAVAKAVSLTDEQKQTIDTLTDGMAAKVKAKFGVLKQLPGGGGGTEAMLEVFGMIGEINGELDAEVAKVLTPGQLRRVRQIQLQKEGPAALLGRHGIRAINPTADQEDKMAAELAKWRKVPMIDEIIASSTGALGGPGNDELPAFHKLLEKFSADTEAVQEAMLKVLTKEQRAMWEKMTGDPLPRKELLLASSAFGDGKLVKAIDEGQNAQLPPPPPPQVVPPILPAGGVPPPVLPPPAEKK